MPKACTLVDRALESAVDLAPELRRHVAECERCGEMYRWLMEAPPELPAELHQRILGTLKEPLEPVSPLPSIRVSVLQFVLLFIALALALAALMGAAGLRSMSPAQILGMAAVVGAGVALISVSLAWQMIPGSRQRFSALGLIAAVAGAFLAGLMLLFPWLEPQAFAREGWPCSAAGLAGAVFGAIVFWLVARRGEFLSSGTAGTTLGAMAGLLGVTVLQLHCTHQEALHYVVWHGAILLVSLGLGALVARSVTFASGASK